MSQSASPDDFVSWIVAIAGAIGKLDDDQKALLEDRIRQDWGGDTAYIARTSWRNVAERDAAVLAELKRGQSVRAVASKFCVGVGTVHRIRHAQRP